VKGHARAQSAVCVIQRVLTYVTANTTSTGSQEEEQYVEEQYVPSIALVHAIYFM
jgi:hypothetical protein